MKDPEVGIWFLDPDQNLPSPTPQAPFPRRQPGLTVLRVRHKAPQIHVSSRVQGALHPSHPQEDPWARPTPAAALLGHGPEWSFSFFLGGQWEKLGFPWTPGVCETPAQKDTRVDMARSQGFLKVSLASLGPHSSGTKQKASPRPRLKVWETFLTGRVTRRQADLRSLQGVTLKPSAFVVQGLGTGVWVSTEPRGRHSIAKPLLPSHPLL